MAADLLLSRLDRVRQRGADQWSARCPAHADRGPSLSVRQLADGRTLVHCFGGCEVAAVMAAVGLDLEALFPPKPVAGGGAPPERRRRLLTAGQALELLTAEALLTMVAAESLAAGMALGDRDRQRLARAAARIHALHDEVAA